MGRGMTQERLAQYVYLKTEVDHQFERIARLKHQELFPAAGTGAPGQHVPAEGSPMERAILRRMDYEEKVADQLIRAMEEMSKIERAIAALPNGQERELLRLRYLDGDREEPQGESCSRHMPWSAVAQKLYGSQEEKYIRAVFRLHRQALGNLGKGDW